MNKKLITVAVGAIVGLFMVYMVLNKPVNDVESGNIVGKIDEKSEQAYISNVNEEVSKLEIEINNLDEVVKKDALTADQAVNSKAQITTQIANIQAKIQLENGYSLTPIMRTTLENVQVRTSVLLEKNRSTLEKVDALADVKIGNQEKNSNQPKLSESLAGTVAVMEIIAGETFVGGTMPIRVEGFDGETGLPIIVGGGETGIYYRGGEIPDNDGGQTYVDDSTSEAETGVVKPDPVIRGTIPDNKGPDMEDWLNQSEGDNEGEIEGSSGGVVYPDGNGGATTPR